MTYDRIEDMPDDVTIVHHPAWPHPAPRGEAGLAEVPRSRLVRKLDHGPEVCPDFHSYDTSLPTAPRAGFVYVRRHWRWSAGAIDGTEARPVREFLDAWTLFVVGDDPVDPTGQYHHPHEVLVT